MQCLAFVNFAPFCGFIKSGPRKKTMPRIMIVEDELATALVLEELLKNLGYEVAGVAHSGEEAVDMAKELTPDLILMDIVLPGEMDGIDAARKIGHELDIPVIFLTGYSEDELIQKATSVEPFGYILKPFQPNQIKAAIEIALYNHKMGNQLREKRAALETRVRESSKELNKTTEQFKALLNATTDTAFLIDLEGTVIAANQVAAGRFGKDLDEFIGTCVYDLMPPTLAKSRKVRANRVIRSGNPYRFEDQRQGIVFDSTIYPVFDEKGNVVQLAIFGKDITDRVRTHEALKEKEDQLRLKNIKLNEANKALKVFMRQKDKDREDIEDTILGNVRELVEPYLKKLKKSRLDATQEVYLDIIESNMTDILSPFLQSMTSKYRDFTPREVQVAGLIREGRTTKEIAGLLDISVKGVEFHRRNLKRKLGIKGHKPNLKVHLISLPQP